MRTRILLSLAPALLFIGACGSSDGQSPGTSGANDTSFPDITAHSHGVTIQLEPAFADLSTNVGADAVRIWLDTPMRPVSSEVFDTLTKGVKIFRQDGTSVAFSVKTYSPPKEEVDVGCEKPCTPTPPKKTSGPTRPYIDLIPKAPLADDWHELAFAKLPEGWDYVYKAALSKTPSFGTNGMRFHPKSKPVPVMLEVCQKKAGFWVASVFFSETLDPDAATKLSMTGAGDPCEYGFGAGSNRLTYKCSKGVPGTWALGFAAGVKAKTGKSVVLWPNKPTTTSVNVQVPSLAGNDGCAYYRW